MEPIKMDLSIDPRTDNHADAAKRITSVGVPGELAGEIITPNIIIGGRYVRLRWDQTYNHTMRNDRRRKRGYVRIDAQSGTAVMVVHACPDPILGIVVILSAWDAFELAARSAYKCIHVDLDYRSERTH